MVSNTVENIIFCPAYLMLSIVLKTSVYLLAQKIRLKFLLIAILLITTIRQNLLYSYIIPDENNWFFSTLQGEKKTEVSLFKVTYFQTSLDFMNTFVYLVHLCPRYSPTIRHKATQRLHFSCFIFILSLLQLGSKM